MKYNYGKWVWKKSEKKLQKKKKNREKQGRNSEILKGFNKLREKEHEGEESVGRIAHLNDERMLYV